MRNTLQAGTHKPGLRRTHRPGPGKPPWPAHPRTLQALVAHGLLARTTDRDKHGYHRETWHTTQAGRDALNPPARQHPDTPRLMHRAYTTTLTMQRGVWVTSSMPEPEQMTPPNTTIHNSRIRHADAQDPRARARALKAA